MKISIATGPWLPVPALQGGAIPRLWQGLAEEFAAQGHDVTLLCRAYVGQPRTETLNGVHYIRRGGFPQSPNIWLDLVKDLTYAVTAFPGFPSADILVINDFWLPIFAALRPKTGRIVINANRYPKGQYWLYSKTSFFAAASTAIQHAITQQYPAAVSRMQVIPNPIDTRIFSQSANPKPNCEEKIILYVGRIHPEKGIDLLLEAFAILSKQNSTVKLRIIGPVKEHQGGGGEEYLQKLKRQAEGLKVEFVDPIFDLSQLVNAYRGGDLFCYPSLAEKGESFGVAPLEAMAVGLVPIVSDLDCFKDFIEQGETGYFFNHRSSSAAANLAEVMSFSLMDWDKTQQMAYNATQIAHQYSYTQVAKLYLAEFESLIQNSTLAKIH